MPAGAPTGRSECVAGGLGPQRVGKPLSRELEGKHSARRGPYRVIYSIDDAVLAVSILRVYHRADVYRTS